MKLVDQILNKLAELIATGRFEEIETDTLEIKPVPTDGGSWKERYKSANAFLNTRGGLLILGIKEVQQGAIRHYELTGYQPHAETKIAEMPKTFVDRKGVKIDLTDCFPPPEIRDFMGGRVAIIYVDELASDRKYCFLGDHAYKRVLAGDVKLSEAEIEAQEEFKEESLQARELKPAAGVTKGDLDLDKLNEYITLLNRPVKTETIKADLVSAESFLQRKCFVKDDKVTTLGMLVCGKHPADHLGLCCQMHGYVDAPQEIARDKQDFADNILPLMESSLSYILRNIQVGVSAEHGGMSRPQYPDELLRETVNNALAHRDYSINKQAIIAIKPGVHVRIQNPGAFRKHLLIEAPDDAIPLRRIIPDAKPRNPKLADVLRVYRKWEGRGIGMATLVNLCLQNQIDLPYYRFQTDEVSLFLCAGRLVDERMERLFQSFDGHIEGKLEGNDLTATQKAVLSYLMKSEWANEQLRYTIMLTPDNNHFNEIVFLEKRGLIKKHPAGTPIHPVYVADRVLMQTNYLAGLRELFGTSFDSLSQFSKDILGAVYRFNRFSKASVASAKQVCFSLWYERSDRKDDIEEFDAFYRKVRYSFNKLEKAGFVEKSPGTRGYLLCQDFRTKHLL